MIRSLGVGTAHRGNLLGEGRCLVLTSSDGLVTTARPTAVLNPGPEMKDTG